MEQEEFPSRKEGAWWERPTLGSTVITDAAVRTGGERESKCWDRERTTRTTVDKEQHVARTDQDQTEPPVEAIIALLLVEAGRAHPGCGEREAKSFQHCGREQGPLTIVLLSPTNSAVRWLQSHSQAMESQLVEHGFVESEQVAEKLIVRATSDDRDDIGRQTIGRVMEPEYPVGKLITSVTGDPRNHRSQIFPRAGNNALLLGGMLRIRFEEPIYYVHTMLNGMFCDGQWIELLNMQRACCEQWLQGYHWLLAVPFEVPAVPFNKSAFPLSQ